MAPPSKAPIITVVAAIAIIVTIIPSKDSPRTPGDLLSQLRTCLEKTLYFGVAFEKFAVIDQLRVLSYLRGCLWMLFHKHMVLRDLISQSALIAPGMAFSGQAQ